MNILSMRLRPFLPITISLLIVLTCIASASYGARKKPREYQLKAVFLTGFTKFIEWPDRAFSKANTPITLCVLGKHPFGQALNIAVARTNKRKRKGRLLKVQYIKKLKQIAACHLLYVSKSERRRSTVLRYARHSHVLTISDMKHFVKNGGMIQFYTRHHKVRFFINPKTVRRAGLEPHGNLLRIADIVR
jgi:hypothetical protein